MKRIIVVTSIAVFSLTGCETMMETMLYHVRLDDEPVQQIAKTNAAVNYCLSKDAIDKNLAYAFNSVSAQLLDITVINRDLYRDSYETNARSFEYMAQGGKLRTECQEVERILPQAIEVLSKNYMRISNQVAVGRAQERQQMATMLSSSTWNQPSYAATYSWPSVKYVEEKRESANYLVNTSNGLVQCRVTNKNYVFCM